MQSRSLMEQKSQNDPLGMEQKSHNGPLGMERKSHNGPLDIARSTRDVPPAHYILKIESFSQLEQILSDTGRENYESDIFEAFGYKWKLSLYPDGHKENNGKGYVSLYLAIAETESLPVGWDVKVNLRLFVFDHGHDTYSIFQDNDGDIRNFHKSKTESGYAKLLPHSVFKDPTNGFLSRDKCVFGVEFFVLNYIRKGECLTLLKKIESVYTWKIHNFSSYINEYYYSDEFTFGNRTWKILIYPKGYANWKGKAVSLYLELNDTQKKGAAYAKFKVRVKDQLQANHYESTHKYLFSKSGSNWGWPQLLTLSDLNNASKGFLVKDTLIVELEIISISSVTKFPQVSSS